ncbi:MAG: hypothetical protein LC731_04445 [Acidobacteria bacterium]|nr:hypothetical protein [Acidobacteriota bacterium]
MPEDPTNPPTTSDPPPGGGSGGTKSVTTGDTTGTSVSGDSFQGYEILEEDPTLATQEGSTMTGEDPTATETKVMPDSDPPPGGGSGG